MSGRGEEGVVKCMPGHGPMEVGLTGVWPLIWMAVSGIPPWPSFVGKVRGQVPKTFETAIAFACLNGVMPASTLIHYLAWIFAGLALHVSWPGGGGEGESDDHEDFAKRLRKAG